MRRGPVVATLTVVLGGPALGTVVWFLLRLGSISSRPGYLVGVAVVALTVVELLRSARAPVVPAVASVDNPAGQDRRGVAELVTLEHRLAWGSVDAERFESRVRPLLVQVATERLRLRHGIDHTSHPDRARSIVGDHLWELMTRPVDPSRVAPGRRELRRIVDRIEKI